MKKVYLAISFSDVYFHRDIFPSLPSFSMIFHSERKVYTVENNQIKYFVQNVLVKIIFVFVQTTSCFATTAMSYVSLSLWSLSKEFFIIQEAAGS